MNPDSTKTRKTRVVKTPEQKLADAQAKVKAAEAALQEQKNKREDAANKVIDAAAAEWPHCGEDRKAAIAELVDAWRKSNAAKSASKYEADTP